MQSKIKKAIDGNLTEGVLITELAYLVWSFKECYEK